MLSKNQLGFFYMFISVCAFSLMDVIVKWSDDYPVGQVLFFRGFCGMIPILFLIPKDRFIDFYKTDSLLPTVAYHLIYRVLTMLKESVG